MPLLKLLFHHDLPLDTSVPGQDHDLLSLFAKPQRTYSKLWLSVSDLTMGTFSLSTFASIDTVLDVLAKPLHTAPDMLSAVMTEPVIATLQDTSEPGLERFASQTSDAEFLKNQPEKTIILKREAGAGGFDLCLLSRSNCHAPIFNALVTLVSSGYEMLSINGKRVHRREMLYDIDAPNARLPHGFEPVYAHYRM